MVSFHWRHTITFIRVCFFVEESNIKIKNLHKNIKYKLSARKLKKLPVNI